MDSNSVSAVFHQGSKPRAPIREKGGSLATLLGSGSHHKAGEAKIQLFFKGQAAVRGVGRLRPVSGFSEP